MNPTGTFERDLERWLEDEASTSAPVGLHEAIIERAGTIRQRPGWIASLRGGGFSSRAGTIGRPAVPVAYLLVVLGLMLALVVGALAVGALRSQPARPAGWTATGRMVYDHGNTFTATLLRDGRVLVAGGQNGRVGALGLASAELYDPGTGSWNATGSMGTPRSGAAATLLPDGRVLMVDGNSGQGARAELYDPGSGTWTATASMVNEHSAGFTATLLRDGRVLVAGGCCGALMVTAELYDPRSGAWTATGSMGTPRSDQSATLLRDGRVLVIGGVDNAGTLATAELFDPGSGTWAATGSIVNIHANLIAATLLPDGRVLMTGGVDLGGGPLAELYDPGSGSWTATRSPVTRAAKTATLLADGKVLMIGHIPGEGDLLPTSVELYDPGTGSWVAGEGKGAPRYGFVPTATLLADGRELVTGDVAAVGGALMTAAELYDPGGK